MKIKTSKLIGTALNWVVAKCENYGQTALNNNPLGFEWCVTLIPDYSTNWACGGPIIERECIAIKAIATEPVHWRAGFYYQIKGPTPLIAAMRCYVVSKLGDVVDVPDEILSK